MMNLSSVAQGIGNFTTKYLLERFIIICHTNAHTIFLYIVYLVILECLKENFRKIKQCITVTPTAEAQPR